MSAAAPPGISRRSLLRGSLALAAMMPLMTTPGDARAAPSAELWRRWTAHDPASTLAIDHSAWDRLVRLYRIGTGRIGSGRVGSGEGIARFAYASLKARDQPAIEGYIASLAEVPISTFNRDQQRAFWLNLYNALTVKVIVDHYPVGSIRDIDISPGLFASGPWGKKLLTIEREPVSLDDIEHRILRPIWADPRIHYGVNCASLGCPNLPPAAFTATNSESMLDAGAKAYVNHPRGARIERGKLIVSSIYVWFENDFGGDDEGVIAHLRRYAEPPLAAALDGVVRIAGHDYDWSLNDAAPPPR